MPRNNKPKTSQPIDTTKVSQMDQCQTPSHALEPLYPYLKKEWIIWESACGEGILADTLRSHGYMVWRTDLTNGEEYNRFIYKPVWDGQIIPYDIEITNMPFSIKYKWLKQAFEDGKRFALLCPYETTAAKEFQKLFDKYNNNPYTIEVLAPERRINFKMPNKGWGINGNSSAQMPTIWVCFGLNIFEERNNHLKTFYVPMRSVKYDINNKEIVYANNIRRNKQDK